MAQESNAETPTAAIATLRQKTREGEASFVFHADRLDYTFASRHGTRVERRIPWNAVPPLAKLRRHVHPDPRTNRLVRLSVVVLIFAAAFHFAIPVSPLLLTLGYAVLLCGLTILLSRRFRLRNAVLPTSDGNIVILGDAAHDEILARLMAARRAALRRFAVIDMTRSRRWNLQRLRWMFEQDMIGRDDFARAQRRLLPGVPEPLLRPAPDTGPDRRIVQHFFNALFVFDFQADHLIHRRRTSLGVEQTITVKYLDLQEPTTAVQVGAPSQLQPQVVLWLLLIGAGYILEMYGDFPRGYFAGPDGLQHGLIVFGPGIAAVALGIVAARRLMRMVCTKLPLDITILRNRQHDEIIDELKRRRRAALKVAAQPDPLLSPAEQANVLAALRDRGIIEAQDLPILMARAAALQKHLGLDEAEPDEDRPLRGEVPATTPSRPTIH